VDDGNGFKLSLEKILEELGTTFSYVSEFLRKVLDPWALSGRGRTWALPGFCYILLPIDNRLLQFINAQHPLLAAPTVCRFLRKRGWLPFCL